MRRENTCPMAGSVVESKVSFWLFLKWFLLVPVQQCPTMSFYTKWHFTTQTVCEVDFKELKKSDMIHLGNLELLHSFTQSLMQLSQKGISQRIELKGRFQGCFKSLDSFLPSVFWINLAKFFGLGLCFGIRCWHFGRNLKPCIYWYTYAFCSKPWIRPFTFRISIASIFSGTLLTMA